MPALSEVAKVAIAVEILKGEATTQLKSALQSSSPVSSVMRFIREHWFGKVLRFSNPSGRRRDVQDCLKNIRFITFNYDRCLEVSLYLFLHYGQSVSREKCIEIIEQIDIVHAYGSLGKIPELGGNRTFGSFDSGEALWASTEIMTYSEEQKSGQIDNIRDLIENSEKLVFLGFGYHPKNLKLLFRNLNTSRKIFGTTFGLDEQQLHDLRLNFQRNFGKIETLSGDCSSAVEQLRSTIF